MSSQSSQPSPKSDGRQAQGISSSAGSLDGTPLDPNLVGLLEELADENGRQLLAGLATWKKPKGSTVKERLRAGSPFLSRLERHLLDVYRDELAALVEDACLELFLNEPAFGGLVYPNRDNAGRPILPRKHEAMRRDRVRLEGHVADDPPCGAALAVLGRLLGGLPRKPSDLLTFALAGSLLRPSDALDIYAARGFEAIEDSEEAERRLAAVFYCPMTYRRKVVAASHLGFLLWKENRREESLNWHKRAATARRAAGVPGTVWTASAAFWAINAVIAGNLSHAQEAFDCLAQDCPPRDPTIEEHCRRLRAAKLAGSWEPDEELAAVVLNKVDQHHGNTKQVRALFQ